jgi:hypothetical protein
MQAQSSFRCIRFHFILPDVRLQQCWKQRSKTGIADICLQQDRGIAARKTDQSKAMYYYLELSGALDVTYETLMHAFGKFGCRSGACSCWWLAKQLRVARLPAASLRTQILHDRKLAICDIVMKSFVRACVQSASCMINLQQAAHLCGRRRESHSFACLLLETVSSSRTRSLSCCMHMHVQPFRSANASSSRTCVTVS